MCDAVLYHLRLMFIVSRKFRDGSASDVSQVCPSQFGGIFIISFMHFCVHIFFAYSIHLFSLYYIPLLLLPVNGIDHGVVERLTLR